MIEWREIPIFPDYLASSDGQVKRKTIVQGSHGRPLNPIKCSKYGHVYVNLYKDKKRHPKLVHRLVLEAFVGPCPEGKEGAHINGIPGDNRLSNLKWATHKENETHKIEHGTSCHKRQRDEKGKWM